MKDHAKAKRTVDVSVGESVRILRELQGLGQNELADLTGIPQSTISAIENIGYSSALNGPRFWRGPWLAIQPFWYFLAGISTRNRPHSPRGRLPRR